MKVVDNIPVWGEPVFPEALQQIKNAQLTGAAHVALMADHHVGYGVPIGGVVAYHELVSPSGVGYDIACGNKAVRLDADPIYVKTKISRIMDDVQQKISFGVGRKNITDDVDDKLFDSDLWDLKHMKRLKQRAQEQLGTVGSGNHYVDIFIDELDRVWVGVHFGSRGLGHGIATHYMDIAKAKGHEQTGITWLHEKSEEGAEYLDLMNLAGDYAYAGRNWVCQKVAKIIGAKIVEEVHNHHNFCWRETHDGTDYWVVRKGATPAFPGQKGFVGGSMGDISVILEGVESEESKAAFYSTVHGAGRVLSRTAATGKSRSRKRVAEPQVTQEMMKKWIKKLGVQLRGADTDEAPQCYKRLPEVLAHHAGSVRILHTLTPIGVAMAGSDVFDPYKD